MYTLGVDLGGTNLVVGLVDENRQIAAKTSVPTRAPRSAQSICDDIAALCDRLLSGMGTDRSALQWAGIGSPGIICNGVVLYASNLQFENVPLEQILQEKLGKPVFLQNDGNAAAYGELIAGAGQGYSSLAALTIGTGIGGGIVLDGAVYSGFNGGAGELGHTVIVANGRTCSCGKAGCVEAYCSATSLRALTQEAMLDDPHSVMWELCDNDLEAVGAKTAFDAMRRGDETGSRVVSDFIFHLSLGVSNTINLLQPEVFCLGGGVAREGETILRPLRELVGQQTYIRQEDLRPKIVSAQLGGDAGLIGAALLGNQYGNQKERGR